MNFVVAFLGIRNRSSYSSSETSLMLALSDPEDFISTAFSSCKLCCVTVSEPYPGVFDLSEGTKCKATLY